MKRTISKSFARGMDDMLCSVGLKQRRSVGQTIAGPMAFLLGGAAIGTTAALLLAPTRGEELRTDLRGKLRQLGSRAKETVRKRNGMGRRQLKSEAESPSVS